MRILHFIPSIDRSSGGVGAYMQLLAKELGKLCDLTIAMFLLDLRCSLDRHEEIK